jgi:hypothetical protein
LLQDQRPWERICGVEACGEHHVAGGSAEAIEMSVHGIIPGHCSGRHGENDDLWKKGVDEDEN